MNERPEQPPEGKIIAAALERSGLSIRKAAERAGISYGRWRQVTTGVQHVSPGEYAAVRAPAATLARMAAAAGVTPEQMEAEGERPDAAEIMRSAPRPAAAVPGAVGAPEDESPSPGAAAFARALGINPDDPDDPFLRPVRRAIAEAIMRHGTGATGSQIFHDYPGAEVDAQLWDDPRAPRQDKDLFLAGMRADRARYESGHGNGHARIGLAAPVPRARPALEVMRIPALRR